MLLSVPPLVLLVAASAGDACISAAERALVQRRRAAVEPPQRRPRMNLGLAWPLAPTADFHDFDAPVISAFVDHDPGPGLRDHACGARTYDGHDGTDIALYPFKWNIMDAGVIDVVAAAPGKVIYRHDGEYDRNCNSADVPANAVALEHADGSTTWYWHLKKGSVTVQQDDLVDTGHPLGKVGSSGKSGGPHLHFEVHDPQDQLVDPFHTPNTDCNALNATSWWIDQRPYHDPRVHKLMVASVAHVVPQSCGVPTDTLERTTFCPGDDILFYRFLAGFTAGGPISVAVRDADDASFLALDQQVPPDSNLFGWYNKLVLPVQSALGEWTFTVTHAGVDHDHHFTVDLAGCPPLPCADSSNCPISQVCVADTCTPGECTTDADCNFNNLCDTDTLTCVPIPVDPGTTTGDLDTTDSSDTSSTTEDSTTGALSTSGDSTTIEDPSTTGALSNSGDSSTSDASTSGAPSTSAAPATLSEPATSSTSATADPDTSGVVPTTGGASDSPDGETGATTTAVDQEPPPADSIGCACSGGPHGRTPLAALLLAGLRRRRRLA